MQSVHAECNTENIKLGERKFQVRKNEFEKAPFTVRKNQIYN